MTAPADPGLPPAENRAVVLGLVTALVLPAVAAAQVPKPVRKQIRAMLRQGTLYARIDMPCKTGRHSWGTYKSPLVEISPNPANRKQHIISLTDAAYELRDEGTRRVIARLEDWPYPMCGRGG